MQPSRLIVLQEFLPALLYLSAEWVVRVGAFILKPLRWSPDSARAWLLLLLFRSFGAATFVALVAANAFLASYLFGLVLLCRDPQRDDSAELPSHGVDYPVDYPVDSDLLR